ncbi:MAG: hypothetical protein RSB09_00355 [Clostridia bacterium]
MDETGGVVLAKRKVTKKYYPPDPIALKTYLELSNDKATSNFSDSELEREKQRLLQQLKTENDKNTKVNEQKVKVNNTQKTKVDNTQKTKVNNNKNTQANNKKSVKPNNQKAKVNDDKKSEVKK